MLAVLRAGRGGRARVWSSAPCGCVGRAHNAVYAWICKPIFAAGGAPAGGSTSSRRWRTARSIRGWCYRGPAPRRPTCPFGWVEEIGRQLSERSCATASAVAGSLSEDALARLLLSDTLADATRLLEAAPRLPPVTAEPANRRFERPQARRCDVGRKHGRDL